MTYMDVGFPPGGVTAWTCAWRINRIKRLSEFGTSLDSASATGTNRAQLLIQLLPQAVPAGALPAPHAFDGRYSNVENRLASSPDRLWSRIRCDRKMVSTAQKPPHSRQFANSP